VNELDLIRDQLRAERTRATEVALACAASGTSEGLRQASVDYLVFVLTRFEERDQRLAEQYRGRPPSDPQRRTLEEIVSRSGTSREALAKLEAALVSDTAGGSTPVDRKQRWVEFGEFFVGPWRSRRDAIDALQERIPRVADWRAISFVDADSIMEERTRYAHVQPSLSSEGRSR